MINNHRKFLSFSLTILIVPTILFMVELPTPSDFVQTCKTITWQTLLSLIGFVTLAMILRGIRWWFLLKNQVKGNLSDFIFSYGWCFLLISFIPARAGEFSRVLWAKKRGGSASKAMGVTLSERLQDLVILLTICSSAIIFRPASIDMNTHLIYFWMIVLCVLYFSVSFGGLKFCNYLTTLLFFNKLPTRVRQQVINFIEGFSILSVIKIHITTLLISTSLWLLLLFGFHIFLTSMLPSLPLSASALVLTLVNISGLIGVTPGNVGVYEAAGILALKAYDINEKLALISISGLHAIVIITTLTYGFFCYFFSSFSTNIKSHQSNASIL